MADFRTLIGGKLSIFIENKNNCWAQELKVTGGGGCNTDILGLYNTNILTAITPGTLKIENDDVTAITPGTLKFQIYKNFCARVEPSGVIAVISSNSYITTVISSTE